MTRTRLATRFDVPTRRILLLLALGPLLAGSGPLAADMHQLFEEGGGSLPNHAQLEGPDDDEVSPLSGDVQVAVKVGPRLGAGGGLELELALHYSSKIWIHYQTNAPVRSLKRQGPLGVGWRLHLGRVYASCRNGCDPSSAMGHLEWTYESPDGAQHPIAFDVPTGGLRYHGTTDGTYIRAEPLDAGGRAVGADEPAQRVALWRLSMGGGVVHLLGRRLEETDPAHAGDLSDDFRGWYTTRIERWGAPGHAVGAIVIAYESEPALAHCISRIDLLAPDPAGALRSRGRVAFHNEARLDPEDPSTAVEGGLTRAITFPAVEGQTPVEVTYDLSYEGPVTLGLDVPGADPPPSYGGQFLLAAVRLPEPRAGAERPEWRFEYDLGAPGAPGTGEMVRRRFPAGALVEYDHATYVYEPPGTGQAVTLREVVAKRLWADPGSADPAAVWTFARQRFSTAHPAYTVVGDPFGNDTVYRFGRWGCPYGCEAPWNAMLATSIETFQGRADGTGRLLRTDEVRYGADEHDLGLNVVPISEWTVHHDWQGKLSGTRREQRGPFGHFSRTLAFGFSGRSVTGSLPLQELPYRQEIVAYDEIDPNDPADAARRALWFLHKETSRVTASGDGRPLRRRTTEHADDGRVLSSVQHLDPSSSDAAATGNLVTRNLYDPVTLALERTYTEQVGTPGAQGRRIEYLDGIFPVRSYVLDPDDPEAPGSRALDHPAERIEREPVTGTILAALAPSGERTDFHYDRLGRPTRVAPSAPDGSAPEHPTVIERPSPRETVIERGPEGDGLARVRRFADPLGRPVETRRLDAGGCEAIQRRRYDAAGRVAFESEWGFDPSCGDPDQAFDPQRGTRFDRHALVAGALVHDPLGRVLSITTADGKSTTQRYEGPSLVMTADVAGRAASTYYEHDAFGRLVRVDAPEGASARYAYDELDRLVRVELSTRAASGPPVVQSRALAYDALGRLVSATGPESGTVFFTRHDASGRVLEAIESDGTRVTYRYDAAGRLLSTSEAEDVTAGTAPSSSPRLYGPERLVSRYTYDEAGPGRLSRVESFDSSGRIASLRRLLYGGPGGRLSEESTVFAAWDGRDGIDPRFDADLRTCYDHDAWGQVIEVRYPAAAACERGSSPPGVSRLLHVYARGALVGLADAGRSTGAAGGAAPILSAVTYNAAGGVRRIVHGNGVVTDVVPDPMSRPGSITVTGPGGGAAPVLLRTGAYTFDGSGNIVSIGPADPEDPEGSTDRFDYDLLSRLRSADVRVPEAPGGLRRVRLTYDFDDFGNLTRTSRVDVRPAGETFTVTATPTDPWTNRLMALNGEAVAHDARGNVLGDRTAALLFDRRDRLVAAGGADRTEPSGIHAYDAAGHRIVTTRPGSGARVFFLRDGSGRVLSEFTLPARRHDVFSRRDYYHALGRVMGMARDRAPAGVQGLESSMRFAPADTEGDPVSWSLSLRWQPVQDAGIAGYRVYRRRAAETAWSLAGQTAGTTFEQGGPQALRSLFYRVVAVDADGREGPPSRSLRIVTSEGPAPEAPPGSVALVERHERSLTLSWARMPLDGGTPDAEGNPATTFLGYNVHRRAGASAPWIRLNTTPLTDPLFHDLWASDAGLLYRYRVTIVDTAGRESVGAALGAARPGDLAPPAVPAGVRALSGPGAGEVTLVWDASAEPDLRRYRVYEKQGTSYELRAEVEAAPGAERPRSHTVSGLAAGVAHTFAVSASDDRSESALSAPATAFPRTPALAIPQQWAYEVLPWNDDPPSVVAVWDPSDGAASYALYRKQDGDPRWEFRPVAFVAAPLERIVTDASVDRCRSYDYLVRARDAEGRESADPAVALVSRPMVRPAAPRAASAPAELAITISWDGLRGCSGSGSDLQVLKWMVRTSQDPAQDVEVPGDVTSYTFRYPEGSDADLARPFLVYARLRDLRRHALDPDDPLAEFDSFLSEDLCASIAEGQVGGELSCADLANNNTGGGGGGRPEPEIWQMRRLVPRRGSRRAALLDDDAEEAGPAAPRAGGIPAVSRLAGGGVRRVAGSRAGAASAEGGLAPPPPGGTSEILWFHHDHLGSVRVVTDAAGAKVAEGRYLPFGVDILGGAGVSPYRFAGGERDDEAALDYMLERHYGLTAGRFTSPDPLDLAELVMTGSDAGAALQQVLIEPARLNRYAYALGSPVSYTDAGGRSPLGFAASIAAAKSLIRSYVAQARAQVTRMKVSARLASWVLAPLAVTAACATANPLACTAGFLSAEYVAFRAGESLMEAFAIEATIVVYEAIERLLDAALDAGARGDWDGAIALLYAAAAQARGLSRGPVAGVLMEIMQAIAFAEREKEREEEERLEPPEPPDSRRPVDPQGGPCGPGVDPLKWIGPWIRNVPSNPLSRRAGAVRP